MQWSKIVARAYQLWKEAGQPQGRDEDFWQHSLRINPYHTLWLLLTEFLHNGGDLCGNFARQ
ncbi:DUF2934 domain-containing protein [Bradyrhizobium sp. AUGA SZCCT0160]|nr:DUF2934 domain-containing protein [Bradyrhizobium sp. AUGA SZCCT0160]